MEKMTDIAHEKISISSRNRPECFPLWVPTSWISGAIPAGMATCRDIGAQIKNEDYRKLFVSAVNEYAREKRCWRSGYRLPGTITGKAAPWTPSWNPDVCRLADAETIYSASIAGILLTFGEITLNKLPANECYA